MPLTVVLMSVLGGTRHWAGPAVGAAIITTLSYASTAGDYALAGKAAIGVILILVIVFMPDGILGNRRRAPRARTANPPDTADSRSIADRRCQGPRRRPCEASVDRLAAGASRCRQVLRGRGSAGRRRPRCRRRRSAGPSRSQRIREIDADQRDQRPPSRRSWPDRLRRVTISQRGTRTGSPAWASPVPTRFRDLSRIFRCSKTPCCPRCSGGLASTGGWRSARRWAGSNSPGSPTRPRRCPPS